MKTIRKIVDLFAGASSDLRRRLVILSALLLVFNGGVWILVFFASRSHPILFGLAVLSYGFGLRHAVDADHIAAIDNTTRKLMHEGKRPVAVGFFFSLGHSIIVIAISGLVALSASFVQNRLPGWKDVGSLIGTSVSALFLLVIGIINLVVFIQLIQTWRMLMQGKKFKTPQELDDHLHTKGIITRLLKPLLKVVNHSGAMFFIGFLFGLGFDTATEVGLLSISATTSASGVPIWAVLLLPLAFTAGMTLVDSIDGVLMLGAYGWAYIKPIRKLYYNMNITFISVVTALFIGGIEALQLLSDRLNAQRGIFALANHVHLENFGFIIVSLFLASWLFSIAFYRFKGYDHIDVGG